MNSLWPIQVFPAKLGVAQPFAHEPIVVYMELQLHIIAQAVFVLNILTEERNNAKNQTISVAMSESRARNTTSITSKSQVQNSTAIGKLVLQTSGALIGVSRSFYFLCKICHLWQLCRGWHGDRCCFLSLGWLFRWLSGLCSTLSCRGRWFA